MWVVLWQCRTFHSAIQWYPVVSGCMAGCSATKMREGIYAIGWTGDTPRTGRRRHADREGWVGAAARTIAAPPAASTAPLLAWVQTGGLFAPPQHRPLPTLHRTSDGPHLALGSSVCEG